MGFGCCFDCFCKFFIGFLMFFNDGMVDDVVQSVGFVAKSVFLLFEGSKVRVSPTFGEGSGFPNWD